jgi:hypothetical protein
VINLTAKAFRLPFAPTLRTTPLTGKIIRPVSCYTVFAKAPRPALQGKDDCARRFFHRIAKIFRKF